MEIVAQPNASPAISPARNARAVSPSTASFQVLLASQLSDLTKKPETEESGWAEMIDGFMRIPGFTDNILKNLGTDASGESDETRVIEYLRENDPELLAQLHPVIDGRFFMPPVENYDVGVELSRLRWANQLVLEMDTAGEFDEIVDAIIGLGGLKNTITAAERKALKAEVINLGKAVILEEDWRSAYIGRMTRQIDVRLISLADYFLNEDSEVPQISMTNYGQIQNPELSHFEKIRARARLDEERWLDVSSKRLRGESSE